MLEHMKRITSNSITDILFPPTDMKETNPVECGMSEENCRSLIAIWAVGHVGTCEDEAYGFRLGKRGFRRVRMEVCMYVLGVPYFYYPFPARSFVIRALEGGVHCPFKKNSEM